MENETQEQKSTPSNPMARVWWVIGAVAIVIIAFCAGSATNNWRGLRNVQMMGSAAQFNQASLRGAGTGMMRGGIGRGVNQAKLLGSLTAINGNSLTFRSNGTDHTVSVSSTTSFYNTNGIAKQSDLQTGDVLIVAGTPDSSGNIQATSIQIR